MSVDSAATDAAGGFVIHGLESSAMVQLLASAPGFGPAVKSLRLPSAAAAAGAAAEPVRMTLTPGRTLRGHVVDKDGHPIAGVKVAYYRWRPNFILDLNASTDDKGQFEMADAPMEPLRFRLSKAGFNELELPFDSGKDHQEVTMVEVAHFRGSVIDAQTRQPISEFTLLIGSNTEDDPKPFFNPLPVFRNGQYDYTARGMLVSRTAWFVRVESKGYAPVQSGPLPLGGLSVTDFELKKAADLTGRIVDADGNPVAGADVILALGRDKVRIKNGRVDMHAYYTSQKRLVVSDAEGRYTFPPQSGNYVVMALGDGGYARADDGALMDSTEIKLKPWGKLAGRAVYHKEAAEGAVIEAEPVSERYPHPDQEWTYTTVADDAGKYFFDRVPAGIVEVTMRIIKPNVDKQTVDGFLESGPATIAAGETVTLELGNDEPGRTFMGRGLIPSQIPGPGKRDLLGDLDLKDKVGDPPMPPGVAGGSAQAQRKWWDDFLLTDDGQTYALMSSYHRRYDVDMDDDGRFKVEGVAPGTYRLTLDAMPRNGIERNGRYDFAHLSMGILMNAKNSKGTTDPFVLPDQELSPDWYLVPAKPAR